MKEDLQLKLVKKYPNLYKNYFTPGSPMNKGFQCGDGWFKIIDWLSNVLEAIGGVVAEEVGKECGATLDFRYSFPDGTTGVADAVRSLVDEAANATYVVCELCGKGGGLVKLEDGARVLCTSCYKSLGGTNACLP